MFPLSVAATAVHLLPDRARAVASLTCAWRLTARIHSVDTPMPASLGVGGDIWDDLQDEFCPVPDEMLLQALVAEFEKASSRMALSASVAQPAAPPPAPEVVKPQPVPPPRPTPARALAGGQTPVGQGRPLASGANNAGDGAFASPAAVGTAKKTVRIARRPIPQLSAGGGH
jgi:hypothetical protein